MCLAVAAAGARLWLALRARQQQLRIASLERTRDGLRERLAALAAADPVVASAPDAGLLIGVPAEVATDLLGRATSGLVRRVGVELRNLKVHKTGQVRLKTILGRTTAGVYGLDLRIHEIGGVLEPGAPTVAFHGRRLGVALPVRIVRGEGRATLRFRWDSRGIAGSACGDFQTRIPVSGSVVPRTYPVSGSFGLELRDGRLEAVPSFPDLAVRLQVEPSPETWKALDRVLAERSLQCRAALKLVDVPSLLKRLLERGFNVKVPQAIFKPIRMPAGLRRELTLAGSAHVVELVPRELTVTPRLVWLGADVVNGARPAAEATPAPSAAPAVTPAPEPTTTPAAPAPAPGATPPPPPDA